MVEKDYSYAVIYWYTVSSPAQFQGVFRIGPPIAIYNCQFGNEFAMAEASARNHHGEISVLNVQKLQELVETYQAPQQQALRKKAKKNKTEKKKKEVINEESEDRIFAFRLRALLRLHRGEDRTVDLNKFGLYLLRLGPLTKSASQNNTLEFTELGKWVEIPLAKIRHGPELLAVDEDLDDYGIVDEDEEDLDDSDNVDSDSSEEEKHVLSISDKIAEEIAQERMQTFSDVVDKVAEELAQERARFKKKVSAAERVEKARLRVQREKKLEDVDTGNKKKSAQENVMYCSSKEMKTPHLTIAVLKSIL
ncbi:hypothetical protein PInf_011659 [Phytophthora infestans]|nr:hypothetical protein PInf_011659 [Phytophthora infestans]